ncbi:MAG TPA: hypothetical protein VMX38_03575 [Verrucomicrobiae bacterium]|nr:hypothetical protein [Verrucomicrobiae bacterium]
MLQNATELRDRDENAPTEQAVASRGQWLPESIISNLRAVQRLATSPFAGTYFKALGVIDLYLVIHVGGNIAASPNSRM